jgi:hypothetical protein
MRKLSDEQWQSLASAMAHEMGRVGPEWTDHNVHDPSITVLEILAYALTDLQYRRNTMTSSGRSLAQRIAQLAGSLAAVGAIDDCPPGLQRVNYFSGQRLNADDFVAEQDYVRVTRHRLNRLLHGAGVVSGLKVTIERTVSSARVVIAPGLAFNARGEEIEVSAPTAVPLPANGKALLVLLHYAEQPCRPVPASDADPQAPPHYSRITETFAATLAPSADDTAVALARVTSSRGRWMLDRKFKAAKARS